MKTINIFFILFFIAFICSAIIQYLYPIVKVNNVNENRAKIEWPRESLWVGLINGTDYSTKVERFFSDHFPLRDFMLRSLGQFEYSVLGRSREVIIGKDGWLTDKKVVEQLHQLDRRINDGQIMTSVILLKQLQHWLQERSINFLMVIIPMKPTIYAEKFPEKYVHRPEQTGLQRFQDAIDNNGIPFLDVLSLLNEHKSKDSFFYKTDMHWNTAGISYIARAMVDYFSCKILDKHIWNGHIIKSKQEFSGKELTTMPLLFPESEMTPIWKSENPGYVERIKDDGPTPLKVFTAHALLPPSIMFGNSFMLQYPTVGFHNYFIESTRVLDYKFFKNVLNYIKPEHKIFILHIYETQLLFHILPPGGNNYWDKRIKDLPLPVSFSYTESGLLEDKVPKVAKQQLAGSVQ